MGASQRNVGTAFLEFFYLCTLQDWGPEACNLVFGDGILIAKVVRGQERRREKGRNVESQTNFILMTHPIFFVYLSFFILDRINPIALKICFVFQYFLSQVMYFKITVTFSFKCV